MATELSILDLILNASLVVQLVMLLLLIASIASWTFIFSKRKELKQALSVSDQFEERFWSGVDLSQLYKQLSSDRYASEGIENIFLAGYREFAKLKQEEGVDTAIIVEGSQRAMRVAFSREMDRLDARLPFLATVGSTSPYVGLFGTVWGIMNSFSALGNTKQATLALVAPGISEALVATAMGLFAAIPAVIAYNRYSTNVERLANRYDTFMEEFISLLQRQARLK
ncbi:MAG: protein TolQ [Gammaproteobacteria bacterium]|nr:MAG: protein TolQ [Gammaproteobacteria bacterium]RLA21919.1 MAG: protein TolQ [Gammaproteobacteria bacterium]